MGEIDRIIDQLRRAFQGPAWHGPSVREALEGVTARQAATKPVPEAHSIWEIVLHLITWHDVVTTRLKGKRAAPTPDEDFRKLADPGEAAWTAALESLEASFARLLAAIDAAHEKRFDQPVVEGSSTVYVTLHGIIQHDIYHAGQIAILKKGG